MSGTFVRAGHVRTGQTGHPYRGGVPSVPLQVGSAVPIETNPVRLGEGGGVVKTSNSFRSGPAGAHKIYSRDFPKLFS